MPKVVLPLNDTQIKNAKPESGKDESYLSDGKGLFLRVRASGTKQWLFKYYRPDTNNRTNISLGQYPSVGLEAARVLRKEYQALLARGIDPKDHREQSEESRQKNQSQTLEAVAQSWFEVKKTQVTPAYAEDVWRSLTLHIFPKLGQVPITQLKPSQAIEAIRPIAAKGTLETVKRLCQRVNEIMVHALNTGLIEANTHAGIYKAFNKPSKKHMPTLPPEELPELMRAINQASIKRITRCLIEWQLHTMVRPSEAAGARWNEIDLEAGLWTIPAPRMKKKKREHIVPLSPQALAILEVLRPISGHRAHLFTSQTDYEKPANAQTANMALKRMGFAGRLVAHGLRSLASTTLNEQRFDAEVIEAALSHVDENQVRAAYNRANYLEQRRVLMSWWSEHIERAANGNLGVAAIGNVVAGNFARQAG